MLFGKIADVGALKINHTRIVSQTPSKLAVADIKRKNPLSAVLQHTVGKTAGRSPEVTAQLAVQREREDGHRFLQLETAAADIPQAFPAHLDGIGILILVPCFIRLLPIDINLTCHNQ